MDKKKLEFIIVGFLLLVFFITAANSFKRIDRARGSGAGKDQDKYNASYNPGEMVVFKDKFREEKKEKGQASWGKDPFVLQEAASSGGGGVEDLRLMGITTGDTKKAKAIINNEIVSIGSRIGKFKVVDIASDRVVVSDGAQNHDLVMQ